MVKLLLLFLIPICTITISAQAPICLENWEGHCSFSEFLFDEPHGSDIYSSKIVNGEFALEGTQSRTLMWDLKKGKYFGWGIDLTQGDPENGFMANNVVAISFKVKLGTGDEKFKLNIKDTNGIQPGISSISFLKRSIEIQQVRIEIKKFGPRVNLASLRDINLSFDKASASRKGSMVIDDFRFEYE